MRRFSTFASVSLVESITVDDLDRQLAQCLGIDGRASFSAIAEVLGVSDQTVARRYRRLRSTGVLRVVGLKYPKSTGYASWFLRLRCVPGSGEAIAAALAKRPDTAWVQLLSGDTEVLCSLHGDSASGSESLLTRMPRSGRIVAVTMYSRLHMFTGGPDALGFMDVLPLDRVAPLRVPVRGRPLPSDAAKGVKADSAENRFCQLWFVDDDLPATWTDTFAGLGADFTAAGLGELVLVAPFRATIPGTDTYTDQLW